MENSKIGICAECGSEFLRSKSKMKELCPECAHWLYGYENCKHIFKDGKCTVCLWNGKKSDYIRAVSSKAERSAEMQRGDFMMCSSLEEVRSNIDRIDNEIIKLIAERTGYVKLASSFKKDESGVKALDRVEAVIKKVREKALEYGADPDMVEALYREMISSFINMEMDEFRKDQG